MTRAKAHMAVPDYQSASRELKSALRINMNLAEARWLLGEIYLDLGEVRAAEKELLLAGELGWPADDVRPALAKAMLGRGKFQQILLLEYQDLHATAAARLLSVQALAELSTGRSEQARQLVAIALQKSPGLADAKLSQARILAHHWDTRTADQIVDSVLLETPDSADAWRLKGQLLLQLEKLEEARAAFDQSIAHSTVAFSDRVTRALISFQLKDYDAVEAESKILLQLSGQHPSAQYIRGLLEFESGQYRSAAKSLSAAEPVARQYPILLYYSSIARLIDNDLDMAEVHAKRYVELAPEDIRGRKFLAMVHLQKRDPQTTQAVIQPVLDYDQYDVEALKIMANALLLDGQASAALDLFARAARIQPETEVYQLGLGLTGTEHSAKSSDTQNNASPIAQQNLPLARILNIVQQLKDRDFKSAIKTSGLYMWENTSQLSAYPLMAKVYLVAGQPEAAEKVLEKALNRDPGNPESSRMLARITSLRGNTDRAKKYCRTALKYYPDDVRTLMQTAELERDAENEAEAISLLKHAIEIHPDDLEPRLMLAATHAAMGRPDKIPPLIAPLEVLQQRSKGALKLAAAAAASQVRRRRVKHAFEETLAQDPDHIPSLLALAIIAEKSGEYAQFERYLGPLTRLAPDEPPILRLRAKAAGLNNDTAAAAALYQRASSHPSSRKSLVNTADGRSRTNRQAAERARMKHWLEMNPYDNSVRVALGVNLESSNNIPEAKTEYTMVLQNEPDNIIALNNLAWLIRFENPSQALEYINRIPTDSLLSPALFDTRAVIQHINGNHEQARYAITQALKLAPDNSTIRYHEAMIIASLGKRTAALAILEELTSGDFGDFPERPEAQALLSSLKAGEQ